MNQLDDDIRYMTYALTLAEQGRGWTSPNPMVGAVVVKDGKIIGEGFHRRAGGPHAEVDALEMAGPLAKGSTLYVTLEPCNHTGRTPPCTEKIIKCGVKRLVCGMSDPNPLVKGGGLGYLQAKGIEITNSVCEKQCQRLNEAFIHYISTGQPFVILKCATTLDGYIGTGSGESKWITGPKSREYVHELRHGVDAIMVGIGTVLKDDPQLTTRRTCGEGSDPKRIILDTNLSISPNARVLHLASTSDSVLAIGPFVSTEKKERLKKSGVRLLPVNCKNKQIDLRALLQELGKMEITSVLIEGGSRINGSALRAGIVNKVCLFYAPKILGGNNGIPIFSGQGATSVQSMMQLYNMTIHQFDEDIMIEGYIRQQNNCPN